MATLKGGDALREKLAELSRKVTQPATLQVGFMEDATYPNGTPVAMVAAIDEYGAPSRGQPPRPFFRDMIAAKESGWAPALAEILKRTDYDVATALEIFGTGVADQLQESIREFDKMPLSPVTLMLRKMKADAPGLVVTGAIVGEAARRVAAGESSAGVSDKQLIETAHMLNSVTKRVVT